MDARPILAAAALLGSLIGGLIVAGPARSNAIVCASGYRADAAGNCQPVHGYVDSRCRAGFEAAPSPGPDGYRCVPIPKGY